MKQHDQKDDIADSASPAALSAALESVLGVMGAFAWSYDMKSSKFLSVDFEGEMFLGYTRDEWGSLQLWPGHIHPEDRTHVVSKRMAAHTNGKVLDVEYRLRCKNDSYVWVRELSGLAELNSAAFVTKGILCNVNEAHGARGLAPEREYQYRRLLDSMPDAFLIEQDNTIVFANPAAERMLELESGSSLIGRKADSIFVDSHHARARHDSLTRGGRKDCTSNEVVQALSGHKFDAELVSCLTLWRNREAIQTVVRDLSWLNKVLELLRDERNLMKLILDNIGDGVCLVDSDGMIKSTNLALTQMFGMNDAAFFGRTAHELFHAIGDEEETTPDVCPICARQAAGELFQFEKTFARDADGASVILRFENTPIFNAGQPYGSVVTIRDLTEELKTQAEIDKLTLAIEQNPVAIQITDLDGRIEYANPTFCSVTGQRAEDLYGRISPFFDGAVVGDDAARDVLQQLRTTRTWEGDFEEFQTADRRYWIRGVVTPMKDTHGNVNYFVGMYRDMTDEKYAAALQKATESKVSVIFESLGNAILIVSENGRIQNTNPAAMQLVGYDDQALRGLHVGSIVPGVNLEDHASAVNGRHLRSGRETVAVTRNGRQIPVILTVAEMPEPEWAYTDRRTRRRRSYICTVQDISEQRNAQNAIENAHKMEALGQLTGGLAHDFNNLLGIVIGNLDLAQEESEDQPDLHSFVTTAQRAALRGAELTRSLLDFSRSSTVNTENLNVNDVVGELEQLMLPALTARITVKKSLENDLWHVNLSRSEFLSALMNLALNARDAMPAGGTVTVSTRNVDNLTPMPVAVGICPPGQYVAIEVADTGEGMDENTLGKMFEPFYTTKEKGKGTGLGLSTVFGFVHRANGVIDVRSKPGEGTAITLLVPRASASIGLEESVPSVQGRGKHGEGELLVVDDEPELASFCQSTLERSGYVVHVAANGADALEVLRDNPQITTMITDVVMPGEFDGIDLCGEVAKVNGRIKIILTTGYAEKLDGNAPLPGNCYDLIRKPFRGRQLLEVVDRVTSTSV